MSRLRSLRLLAIALGFLGGGCQQTIPKSAFDARKVDQTVKNLTFTNVSLRRKLDPKLLQPPSDPYILGPGDVVEIEITGLGTLRNCVVDAE